MVGNRLGSRSVIIVSINESFVFLKRCFSGIDKLIENNVVNLRRLRSRDITRVVRRDRNVRVRERVSRGDPVSIVIRNILYDVLENVKIIRKIDREIFPRINEIKISDRGVFEKSQSCVIDIPGKEYLRRVIMEVDSPKLKRCVFISVVKAKLVKDLVT